MSDVAIDCQKLSKRYGRSDFYALHELTLQVRPGDVYGFLGPNGAGKSTTIRTLLNFIQPSGGSAAICGLDSVKDSVQVKRHVGYLAGEIALYDKMTGKEFLAYMTALQPLKQKSYTRELIKRFEADPNKPLGTLSKGNRQKFGLIQAVMHQPDVLILDEPTSGLDPLMQEEFFKLIHESRQRGAAVFVSSHNFAEVQRMCDRIGFIRDGKLIVEQALADLADKAAHTFTLTFADAAPVGELKKLPKTHVSAHDEHHITVSVEGELTPLLRVLGAHHVTRLEQQEINLEEEFMRFYKGAAAGKGGRS
jgi:ABC-2 type transport system ATP-binding protein